MKKIHRLIIVVILIAGLINRCHSQARLVLNGGKVNISNSALLVVDNPATNAITRDSGHIISEGENNRIRWNIENTSGTYTIPWGVGNATYLPLTFTKSSGLSVGTAGRIIFSTYHTPTWQNSLYLPSGVSNVSSASGAADNSAKVIDRFWMMDAVAYSVKPNLANLTFTYMDAEHSIASNSINENNLKAQRYNSTLAKWGDYAPAGIDNTAANTVTVIGMEAAKQWQPQDILHY